MPLDPPPWLRRLATGFPPPLRRALAGVWLDLTGLPSRFGKSHRRRDPWQSFHNVGGGDFFSAGQQSLVHLREFGLLTPDSHVLDIGCGSGRVAAALAPFLSHDGKYVGFDVSRRAIASCRRRFLGSRPDFDFIHANLANTEYNARGAVSEASYHFPVEDRSVDLAFAASVFTHMQVAGISSYLRQVERVLKPGGRFLFTVFAISPGRTLPPKLLPFGTHSWILDRRSPERMIAHDAQWLRSAIEVAGLQICESRFGAWASEPTYSDHQDLYVVALR